MRVFISKANERDAEALLEIQKKSFQPLLERYQDHGYNPACETLKSMIQHIRNGSFYKIFFNDAHVGGIMVHPLGEQRHFKLRIIFVLPEFQNNGIAQAAIRLVEELHPDVVEWQLETPHDLEWNHHVYEKIGYIQTGQIDKINDKLSLIHFRKVAPNLYVNAAEYYDYDVRDIVKVDIPFYLEYAEKNNKDVLELACGTGRVTIALAKDGHRVYGIDLSDSMLKRFSEKTEELTEEVRSRVSYSKADMSCFELNKKFGLIIVPFRGFQALTDESKQHGCLRRVRKHLEDDGNFIINVFRPFKVLDETWIYPETIQWETTDEKTGCRIVKKHRGKAINIQKQIIYPEFTYEITYPDGSTKVITELLELKYYYYDQLKEMLASEGFKIAEEYGWYDKSDIHSGKEMIFVCRKE